MLRIQYLMNLVDSIKGDAGYAGVEQDPEVVAADRTQWREVLALLVS